MLIDRAEKKSSLTYNKIESTNVPTHTICQETIFDHFSNVLAGAVYIDNYYFILFWKSIEKVLIIYEV